MVDVHVLVRDQQAEVMGVALMLDKSA
jgi:hypothetical protein